MALKLEAKDILSTPTGNSLKKPKYRIGIDPGVRTGLAEWSEGALHRVETHTITKAMEVIKANYPPAETRIFIEDPRKWVNFKGSKPTKETMQRIKGAGSITRDASIWEQWFKENGYSDVTWLRPFKDSSKKLDEKTFRKRTGWQDKKQVSEHASDPAMLVYGRGY